MPRFVQITPPNSTFQGSIWIAVDHIVRLTAVTADRTELTLSGGETQSASGSVQLLLRQIRDAV